MMMLGWWSRDNQVALQADGETQTVPSAQTVFCSVSNLQQGAYSKLQEKEIYTDSVSI